jgi:hypothetical protein
VDGVDHVNVTIFNRADDYDRTGVAIAPDGVIRLRDNELASFPVAPGGFRSLSVTGGRPGV